MKKHRLLIALAVFSVVLAGSAVACSDDSNGGGGTGTPAENTPAEGGAPGTDGEPVDVTMNGFGDPGASGTTTLAQTDQGLEVGISLSGLTPGTYQTHIHPYPAGDTCTSVDRTGPVTDMDLLAVALPDLVVDSSGEVETTTTIPLTGLSLNGTPVSSTLADLQDSNSPYHVEVYDFSRGSIEASVLACGDIPAAS